MSFRVVAAELANLGPNSHWQSQWHVADSRGGEVSMEYSPSDERDFEVVTTFVEMLEPSRLRRSPRTQLEVIEAQEPSPELNRFLYSAVGGPWHWTVRLSWSYDEWMRYLDRDELRTWVGYFQGTPAGYFEMEVIDDQVEICSFGLLPQFTDS